MFHLEDLICSNKMSKLGIEISLLDKQGKMESFILKEVFCHSNNKQCLHMMPKF